MSEVRERNQDAATGSWFRSLLSDPEHSLRRAERLASSQAAVLELIARGVPLADVAEAGIRLLEDNGVAGRSSIYLLDSDRLELRAGDAPAEADRSGAAWSQPILSTTSGRPVGSISILYEALHEPTDHERRVADVSCNLIAIAVERAENERKLAHQALHDALTGLPNRTLLLDRMGRALERRTRTGADVALLFCDIDRFKVINDSLGHAIGDQLLVAFAERFRSVIAPGDTVARFGGDEFVVLIEDVTTDQHPIQVAEALADALERPFLLPAGHEVYLTVSTGLARPIDHSTGDDWLRDADAAMYRAKERGRNRLAQFDHEMRDAAVLRLQVEQDLRRAVDRGELVVHYQPVIDLGTGRIVGAEALVRWQHPERGLLAPREFIAVAEDIGTIGEVGRHVLGVAVADMDRLRHLLAPGFQLGVNISARQLSTGGLDRIVRGVLERHGWPGESLLLEITESALLHGLDGPVDEMRKLHDLGVSLAIDDFGTGYSSLARLGHLPVDQVKIDRSFVNAIDRTDDRLVRIVDAVIAIAGALDHRTTAEGVETQTQLDYLRRMHCDHAQGWLFSKAVPYEGLHLLLASDPRW